MKKTTIILTLLFLLILSFSHAQLPNANPDSTGNHWTVGHIPEYTSEIIAEIEAIPELELSQISAQTTLPFAVDNSILKYMRSIIDQSGWGFCSSAASIGYTYTYEFNRLRDKDASLDENMYHYFFPWNFLNGGDSLTGSFIQDCLEIVKENGCPNFITWGDSVPQEYKKWLSGYDKYDSSMFNRLDSYETIYIYDSAKLDILKHWLSDHNEGAEVGGLANFVAAVPGYFDYAELPPESAEEGKWLVTSFGGSVNHSWTIVGYNDSIMYDFNEDDYFTNDQDINHDDTIDLRDWEIGAVKVANSWSENYKDSGYVFVPYRLLAMEEDSGGIFLNRTFVVHLDTAQPYYQPELVIKAKIQYEKRDKLRFKAGYASEACSSDPSQIEIYRAFSRNGGPFPMQGINSDPIEIELDYSYWFGQLQSQLGKIFLIILKDSVGSTGQLIDYSIVDYRWGEEFELPYNGSLPITIDQDSIVVAIEYDLLPFNFSYIQYDFECNKICRLQCRAYNDAEITFDNGINVDFYNGTLTIEEGATLIIEDSVTIHAKTGADSLIVYGDIEIGDHVNFIADEDASLFIYIENDSLTLTIDSAYFENTLFEEKTYACTFNNSGFSNSMIKGSADYFLLSSSELTNTPVRLKREKSEDTCIARVEDCIILYDEAYRNNYTPNPPSEPDHLAETLIGVEQYHHFLILNDSIVHDELDGIKLYYAGSGLVNKIKDCHIHFSGDVSTDTSYGIIIYRSYVDVQRNYIDEHTTGVACLDKSNSKINSVVREPDEDNIQHIINNKVNQVYALAGSFPHDFQYNYIYNVNYTDTLVYYNTIYSASSPYLDVRMNYWGLNGLDTLADLHPNGDYIWYPEWNGYKSTPTDSDLFTEGEEAMADGNNALAESKFKEIIEYHPDSKYVNPSVKILLVLKRLYDQDFEGLQNYLDSIPTLWEDEITANVTDHVINWCNIEKEDYVAAITWFEDQIENPNSYADSICAIIDLGYTYTLMDTTSNKSSGFIGNYPQYRPVSREAYEKNREYLVDLLFRKKSDSNEEESKPLQSATFNLQQNYPNPVRETTTIKYTISNQSHVKLNVYNTLGSIVTTLVNEIQREGGKQVTYNIQNLPNGPYYYSLEVDGEIIGVRKMVVLR